MNTALQRVALLSILLQLCINSFAENSKSFRLVGTDFFKGAITESIQLGSPSIGLETEWTGSHRALQFLKAGKCDLALIACTSTSEIPVLPSMGKLPIAYRISRVLVAKDNPLTEINVDQLAAIFGSRAERKISLWGELELQGTWRARAIEPMLAKRFTSFSREILAHHALKNDRLQSRVKIHTDEKALAIAFQKNPGAIGVFASLHADSLGKPISIALKEGEAFGATPENLYFGDYPLQMPFVLLYPERRAKELLPVFRLFYSAEVAQAIFQAGLAPVPDNFRNAELKKVTE